MSGLTRQLQLNAKTCADRHMSMLTNARSQFRLQRAKSLCSFGCSSGEEIETLLRLFLQCEEIVGVEINEKKRTKAIAKFAQNAKVIVLSPAEFEARQKKEFDLIVALNVLCNYEGISYPVSPLPFAQFCDTVRSLTGCLNPDGGVLLVYGANYSVKEVELQSSDEFILERFLVNSGPVPVYCGSTGQLLPRSSDNMYIIRRRRQASLQEDEKKKPTTPIDAPVTNPTIGMMIDQKVDTICAESKEIVWGIMHPGKRSNNLGDYMQTLAQLNVLSTFFHEGWQCSEALRSILSTFSRCKACSGPNVRQKQYSNHVRLIWFDRDASNSLSPSSYSTQIHVICNGWFMHPQDQEGKVFGLPFAEHVRPIFVSMHVANRELLDASESVCAYLRKHAPIGCRDRATCELMKSHNIEAYFSSCLTTTLELPVSLLAGTNQTQRSFRVDVLDQTQSHHIPRLAETMTQDESIQLALRMLLEYANAEQIDSMRIHCLLPVRAVSDTPRLTFCSKSGGQDVSWMQRERFSGLVECMENAQMRELYALVLFEHLTDRVHDILFNQVPDTSRHYPHRPNDTIDLSAHLDLPYSLRYLRLQHPRAIRCLANSVTMSHLAQHPLCTMVPVTPVCCDLVLRHCTIQPFLRSIDVFVTFDKSYATIFGVFLDHLAYSNRSLFVRVHCATRGILSLEETTQYPNIILYHYDLDDKITFREYDSPLGHVSSSCLDRLLVPLLQQPNNGLVVLERVVYMDLDICVTGSLEPLLDMDTGTKGIIAKTSHVPNVINSWIAKYEAKRQDNSRTVDHYKHVRSFNAGVLVMDVSKLKHNKMWEYCKAMYERTQYNDQIVLNFYADGEYKELPPEFNIFVGQDHAQFLTLGEQRAVGYHFVGSQKPWCFTDMTQYPHGPQLWTMWHTNHDMDTRFKKHHLAGGSNSH